MTGNPHPPASRPLDKPSPATLNFLLWIALHPHALYLFLAPPKLRLSFSLPSLAEPIRQIITLGNLYLLSLYVQISTRNYAYPFDFIYMFYVIWECIDLKFSVFVCVLGFGFVNNKAGTMNGCVYRQNSLVGCIGNMARGADSDGVVCPKPRRVGLPLQLDEPIRSSSRLLHIKYDFVHFSFFWKLIDCSFVLCILHFMISALIFCFVSIGTNNQRRLMQKLGRNFLILSWWRWFFPFLRICWNFWGFNLFSF